MLAPSYTEFFACAPLDRQLGKFLTALGLARSGRSQIWGQVPDNFRARIFSPISTTARRRWCCARDLAVPPPMPKNFVLLHLEACLREETLKGCGCRAHTPATFLQPRWLMFSDHTGWQE